MQPGQTLLMSDDPRLPKMPKSRRCSTSSVFALPPGRYSAPAAERQSSQETASPEKIITACLLHDIGVVGFIRADHGYWGAQLIEPYVDEEVSWAIRVHQALRFYPDESVGYTYPEQYVRNFGADFKPEPYIEAAYKAALEAQVA